MWRFDDERSIIRCVGPVSPHRRPVRIRIRSASPRRAATTSRRSSAIASSPPATPGPIRAPASSSTRTSIPNDIGAMLDVPLRHDNTTVGVLCAEHVGGARAWTVDEQNFAISVANLIVVAVAEEERRSALARLAESETRARLIVDTAHDAFIGIDSTGRIAAWNAQAEADVRMDARRGPRQESGRDDRPAGVSRGAHQRDAALSRNRRGSGRQSAARIDGPASIGARVPGRAHHHVADARRRAASFSARFSGTFPIDASGTPSSVARRSRPRPRRGPRASSWQT